MDHSSFNKMKIFSKIMNKLDQNGYIVLSDKIGKITKAFIPDDMDVSYLSDIQQEIPQQTNDTEIVEDDDMDDGISPKDIDNLLNKLEAVIDAMGNDFDPDLIPVAKKILKELLEKFESIDDNENIETNQQIPDQQYVEQPNTPSIAKLSNSLIRLAEIADELDENGNIDQSEQIDQMISDTQRPLLQQNKIQPVIVISQHAIDRAVERSGIKKKAAEKTIRNTVLRYLEKNKDNPSMLYGDLVIPYDNRNDLIVKQKPNNKNVYVVITLAPSSMATWGETPKSRKNQIKHRRFQDMENMEDIY